MAPFNRNAMVTVLSAQALSSDEKTILVEAGNFTPMRWFLERAASTIRSEGPPCKRRKIGTVTYQSAGAGDSRHSIPVHKVSIDFHFPETLKTSRPGDAAFAQDIDFELGESAPVVPLGFEQRLSHSVILLGIPGSDEAILRIEAEPVPKPIVEAFAQIAPPDQVKDAYLGRRQKNHPATKLHCYLLRSVGQLHTAVRLQATLSWTDGISAFPAGVPVGRARIYKDYELLIQCFPDLARENVDHGLPWTPQDFYDSVHVPAKSDDTSNELNEVLESQLYPFQKRAVNWMLKREGMFLANGQLETIVKAHEHSRDLNLNKRVLNAEGKPCFVNHLTGTITEGNPTECRVSGGILAEEMGLGKTVELIALLYLHRRPATISINPSEKHRINEAPSNATLIITPSSILEQWKAELRRHAPSLKVMHYKGIGKETDPEDVVLAHLATEYDVVLTTYQTLSSELHFAEDPPERSLRHVRRYDRKRSPLVRLEWWRICLDEAQMVESGVTAAARVACRLPRVHSWAVSGTPLRKNVQDLYGLLLFLQCQPFSDNSKLWSHLIANHRHIFRQLFGSIALRHTKAQIRDELRLPAQKRVVITMPFSAVEQQHYSQLLSAMFADVGVDETGAPINDEWDPHKTETIEAMRSWLVRLRQTCLHPQVGGRNRKALGRGQAPLRTVAEVLEVMIEQSESSIRIEQRALLSAHLQRAHVLGNNNEDDHRSEKALAIYNDSMEESARLVADAREQLAAARASLGEKGCDSGGTEDEESDTESTPLLGRARNNLRIALQLQHVCTFFSATAYYQIKSNEALTVPDSARFQELESKETLLYETAKQLRKEILRDTSRKADGLMRRIKDLETKGGLAAMPIIEKLKSLGGIESLRLVEKSDQLFRVIRSQARTLVEWRLQMARYLLEPLVDEDEGNETTGDEYEDSTKHADELYVYFDAVKALQADMNNYITGEDAPLIDHEVKCLVRDAKWFLDPDMEFHGIVHAPELLLKLFAVRNDFLERKNEIGSIRGLIQEARTLDNSMQWQGSSRSLNERAIIVQHLSGLQKIFKDYTKALGAVEKEIDLFRSTQNQRIEFYRQLQELSDAVAPYKEELDPQLDVATLNVAMQNEDRHDVALARLMTKHRFLLHLRQESGNADAQKICVICQCAFENGVLTVCGHQYCKECIQLWWQQHKTCPVCKRRLTLNDFHNITYKPREFRAQEEVQSASSLSPTSASSPRSTTRYSSIYADIDSRLLDQIKSVDLPTSYGTKIDALGRHLHWLREHDPGAKSIVFSQYREFLDVLGPALHEFKIGYARLGKPGAVEKFRHDPSVDCLLLDAKTDSSGLTLVNATHVFICEPLIQTAVELQAIARVHRIGQTRQTTVWMYLISHSVEEAIYGLSVSRRLAHVQSRQVSEQNKSRATTPGTLPEMALEAANSEEMQSAPLSKLLVAGKGGGELVGNDDLWQCLFGKSPQALAKPSVELEAEVGRHLRATAAEERGANESAAAPAIP